jgi:hypothetical protein
VTFKDKEKRELFYVDNEANYKTKTTFSDGAIREGLIKNGEFHGDVLFTDPKRKVKRREEWVGGVLVHSEPIVSS